MISGLYHTASVHPVYASSNALPHSHARLGSGCWLGFTGRVSNPLNSCKWFPPASASPTTRFILALSQYIQNRHGPACPPAGSAGGISPPAAHRTVRKRLHLHGSSQPFPCHLAVAKRHERSRLLPVSRLAATFVELSHPLCSTPITGASTLVRDDPPPSCASVLSPFVDLTYKVFPWHHMKSSQVSE